MSETVHTWRRIAGWPYEISDAGEVRNIRTARILRQDTVRGGYKRVTLSDGGTTCRFMVNRMVCEAFHGPAPSDTHHARHRDGNASNNRADNLRWGTPAENAEDKRGHGTDPLGERNPFSILSEDAVAEIRDRYNENLAQRRARGFVQIDHGFVPVLASDYDVSVACIKAVVSGRNWRHL